MTEDASFNKRKNSGEATERGALFSGVLALLGIQWLSALIAAFAVWGLATIGLANYVLSGTIEPINLPAGNISLYNFGESLLTGTLDPLILVVVVIIVGVLLIPVAFSAWALISVANGWQMRVEGYRNLLTLAVGQVIVSAILLENIALTIISFIALAVLFGAAHFKFYPEYEGMPIRDFFSDLRFIRVFWQVFFVAVIMFSMKFLAESVYQSLVNANALPTFDFLFRRAGFAINQSGDWYSADSRYGDAFIVGVINTLRVVWIGLVLSTVFGVLLGIFLLSNNWLVRTISRIYVEILRNTPLLLQLIFWFFVFWLSLPADNVTVPNESVMVVQLRYFVYLFALIGALVYVWRFNAPNQLFSGFLVGFLIAEAVFFVNASYIAIVLLGVVGIGAIYAANQEGTIPSRFSGLAMGAGAMLMAQFVGHALLDGLAVAGITESARIVYGEVVPLAIFGPNVFALPNIAATPNFQLFAIISVVGLVVAIGLYTYWGRVIDSTGADIPRTVYATGIVLIVVVAGWLISARPISPELAITIEDLEEPVPLSQVIDEELLDEDELAVYTTEAPILVQPPELNRFGSRVLVGVSLSPNYAALLLGLVVYTSAYIGEIVRAGIQAVPWGQVEASRALGLSTSQTLRMIILPQALRVILPPLGNQYLNLSKNSSLATAIAFADTYQVGQTIMNQSGQSITGFFIILMVYLTLSLIISFVMNIVNSRFQLVTR
ncbi:MAG: ABC transporter permease subunit [Chloroflexota bacterium]